MTRRAMGDHAVRMRQLAVAAWNYTAASLRGARWSARASNIASKKASTRHRRRRRPQDPSSVSQGEYPPLLLVSRMLEKRLTKRFLCPPWLATPKQLVLTRAFRSTTLRQGPCAHSFSVCCRQFKPLQLPTLSRWFACLSWCVVLRCEASYCV